MVQVPRLALNLDVPKALVLLYLDVPTALVLLYLDVPTAFDLNVGTSTRGGED